MTRIEYFKYAVKHGYLLNKTWYYDFCTLPSVIDNKENNKIDLYSKREDGLFKVRLEEDQWELLDNVPTDRPIYITRDPITVDKTVLDNVYDPIDTTIGRVILNKVLLERTYGPRIQFINKKTSIGDIEKILGKALMDDKITPKEFVEFSTSVSFLQGLAPIFNISATYKNVLPPDGLPEFKAKMKAKYDKEYGPDWTKNRLLAVQFQEELKKFDAEWLKGDPSDGTFLSKRIKTNSRVKMFLTFGPVVGFDKSGGNTTNVYNSLEDGYPLDREQLCAVFNAARVASYDRGHNTQQGGVAAKNILRSIASTSIEHDDCGTTSTLNITVDSDNASFIDGRYIIEKGKPILVENAKSYIGQTVKLRSPMYCKNNGNSFCKTCAGKFLGQHEDGISLLLLKISAALLTISLKGMHNTQVNLTSVNLHDILT